MNILILCDLFPPAFGPRMGYLCKYLKRAGWQPTVITEYIPDQTFAFLSENIPVHSIRFYKFKKGFLKKLEWFTLFVLDTLFDYKNRRIYKEAERLTNSKTFDAILCSTYRTFPLTAASKIAKKRNLPFVIDLRDIIEQYTGNEFISRPLPRLGGLENWIALTFKKQSLKKRNRVLSKATHVTTVSPWHVDILSKINPRVSLVYNGYDPEVFFPAPTPSNRFFITYTGRILSLAMRNPDLLFQAIEQLAKEQIISPDAFEVRWYVDNESQALLTNAAKPYQISEYMHFYGYVNASVIPSLLNESAIILLLTNKSDELGPKGIMTTKFFEALAVEKPILCVRGDEGCLEDTIQRTQSGLSAHRREEVYTFIKHSFEQWKENKISQVAVNHAEIEKFSRKAQAEQFMEIFRQITQFS